ncbi:extensin-like domain-containing protein [Phaeovulum vinaykumarii]|uniref:Uncharacterized conserved protein n=1 Tax=Phaeovulum vinaykumarii TaxID=407234 RepID=A0A1N7M4Q9_9RHOB|nr:extensin family protein [Phaeovulum vinaykumarii]SIS80959.1 Uncharacterized conserved protein [Phaeovulum vinaykumarii]SOC08797.1 hypothetical protein SAMN05878426_10524 [Phaeovulum vinaykumarii]
MGPRDQTGGRRRLWQPWLLGLCGALLLADGAAARAPSQSPFPVARPLLLPDPVPLVAGQDRPARAGLRDPGSGVGDAPPSSPHPPARPPRAARSAGVLCGTAGIEGVRVPAIPGKIRGCGLVDGVKVSAVSGIRLAPAAIMDCRTARALKTWVDRGIVPAVGRRGGGLAGLEIAAHYACRTRNNQPGAKVSEHGRGRAIDVSGLRLANGQVITVLRGWRSEPRILKAVHRAACGPFGTVLGPKSDRFHQDHIHVDTARSRSGPYCR